MRLFINFALLFCVLLTASCSLKIPVIEDNAKGIAVIPLEVINDTRSNKIPYEFSLIDYARQKPCVKFTARPGQEFIFTEELEPGDYQVYKVVRLFSVESGTANVYKKEIYLNKKINFSIKPNSIMISDAKFIIKQTNPSRNRIYINQDVGFLMDDERLDLAKKLKELENPQNLSVIIN